MKYLVRVFMMLMTSILIVACSNGSCMGGSQVIPATPDVTLDPNAGGIANGESDVALKPNIVLQFSTPMNPTTINSQTVTLSMPVLNNVQHSKLMSESITIPISTIVASNNNTVFTFTSESPLMPSSTYYINVNNAKTVNDVPVSNSFYFSTGEVQFVAGGRNGTIVYSLDGVNWETTTFGDLYIHGLTYADNKFIAVGESGLIYTSYNGVNWESQISNTVDELFQVVYGGNSLFVSVGCHGTVVTSPNAIDWTVGNVGNDCDLYGLTYGNGYYVSVGESGATFTSNDAVNWIFQGSFTPNAEELTAVTYGDNKYVAVGQDGVVMIGVESNSWHAATASPITSAQLGAVIYAHGIYVAAARDGGIFTSVDAESWIPRISNTTQPLFGITYGMDKFIAVGVKGTIISSMDGINWTVESANTPKTLFGITSRK